MKVHLDLSGPLLSSRPPPCGGGGNPNPRPSALPPPIRSLAVAMGLGQAKPGWPATARTECPLASRKPGTGRYPWQGRGATGRHGVRPGSAWRRPWLGCGRTVGAAPLSFTVAAATRDLDDGGRDVGVDPAGGSAPWIASRCWRRGSDPSGDGGAARVPSVVWFRPASWPPPALLSLRRILRQVRRPARAGLRFGRGRRQRRPQASLPC